MSFWICGTESEELVDKRMAQAKKEIENAPEFDYVVTNDTVEQAAGEIAAIVAAEHARYVRRSKEVETLLSE